MSTAMRGTPQLDQLQFDLDVAQSAFDGACAVAEKALKAAAANLSSTHYIQQHTDALNLAQAQVQDAIAKGAVARGAAKAAAYDGPSVKAQGPQVVAAIKRIAATERALLKLDTAIDKMIEQLCAKENAQMDLEIAYEKEWHAVHQALQRLGDQGASMLEALKTFHGNAVKAAQRASADSLALAQEDAKSLAVPAWVTAFDKAAGSVEALLQRSDTVGSESRQAVAGVLRKARRGVGELKPVRDTLAGLRKTILEMKPQPLDLAKVAKKLGVPDALKAMLGKALAQAPAQQPKALDALATAAGLKVGGKAIVKMLAEGRLN